MWYISTKISTIQISRIGRQETENCSAEGSKRFVARGMNSNTISKMSSLVRKIIHIKMVYKKSRHYWPYFVLFVSLNIMGLDSRLNS